MRTPKINFKFFTFLQVAHWFEKTIGDGTCILVSVASPMGCWFIGLIQVTLLKMIGVCFKASYLNLLFTSQIACNSGWMVRTWMEHNPLALPFNKCSQVMLRMGSTCRRHKPATLGANKPKCLAEVEEEEAKAEEAHKENTMVGGCYRWPVMAIGKGKQQCKKIRFLPVRETCKFICHSIPLCYYG